MKLLLVIDVADDVAEAYEDFTVDYDFRGTPKEDRTVNESIKYIEDAEPRPLPKKMKRRATDGAVDLIYATGYNKCLEDITGETE